MVLIALVSILAGAFGFAMALTYAELTRGLPPIEDMEEIFGPIGREMFRPIQFYDRKGETVLLELIHPSAQERRWYHLDPTGPITLPAHSVWATTAIQDETFWTSPGYESGDAFTRLVSFMLGQEVNPSNQSITQRLVSSTLLPLTTDERSALVLDLRSTVMAARLTDLYPKERILEWYINTAFYGHYAYGIDSAALVYFGKHASELSLAESAMLAHLPLRPDLNPIDTPVAARAWQEEVLEAMVQQGHITERQAESAMKETVLVRQEVWEVDTYASEFALLAWSVMGELLGSNAQHRHGLKVLTTLDNDLQLQADCTSQTLLKRLSGVPDAQVESAADQTACIAAGLLPPLRPRDMGFDHNLTDAAVVVIDVAQGEVLSLSGLANITRPSGTAFLPLTYLSAFAQGYSPATMVLDIPHGGEQSMGVNRGDVYEGPVRIRTALANSYSAAAERTVNLIGAENVVRTANSMGLRFSVENEVLPEETSQHLPDPVSLLELTYAYSVMANQGTMTGVSVSDPKTGSSELEPRIILEIEDSFGRLVYRSELSHRAVLSPQLAYLMVDVLSDDAARWPSSGRSNPLEIGRPAGAKTGVTPEGKDVWAVGFTATHAVGVWVGNLDEEELLEVHDMNGAAPIWHAVIQYATRDQPSQGWGIPPGVNQLDVCDPSGLLPTEYCPSVVQEIFIQGTEPTQYDNLFLPYLINRETGKLATLFTPIEVVEERVFMIPPPEAVEWAKQAGIERPPEEYDTLIESTPTDPEVRITSPTPFEHLRGTRLILGDARSDGFEYYRVQYGQGLNPTRWFQLGGDMFALVESGVLAEWDTQDLTGLYTLQLIVVLEEGQIKTSSIPITVDNKPPSLTIISPEVEAEYSLLDDQVAILEVVVEDDFGIDRIVFFVDDRQVASLTDPPFSTRWDLQELGEHEIFARAFDEAGNQSASSRIHINILP